MTSPDPLSHLSPRHRRLFLEYGFGEHKSISHVSIIDAFRTHLQSTPGAAAVEYLGESITYQDLDRQSSQLAARLQQSGVRPGHRVVLLVKRSIPMVVGILGILKAGAAYVPLDGGIVPDTTLAHIISDANVQVILTLKAFAPRLVSYDVRSLLLDEVSPKMDVTGLSAAHDFTGLESAYIIYTSGTTGTPKGVDVTHRNVLNLVTNSPGDLGMKPGMRVSQLLNIAFDMAQWECLGSLVNGCTLCLRGSNWLDVLRTVDIVISTPSCLRKYTPTDFQPKVIATAGEPCPQVLADRWIASGTKYYNCCGPTETTIVNTIHEHTKLNQTLSIGRPTPNNNVYILDEEMKPVSIGDAGMIWAGGLGVARGYLNLPEKTADSFRPDVFANSGGMMYKTVSRPASEIVATDEIPGAGVSATEGIELKGSNLADPSTHEARSTDSIVPQVLNADAPEDTSDIQKASTQTQVSKLMPSPGLTTSPSNLSVGSNSFDDRLLFAVPKKGRLHEKCMDMLRRADLQFTKPNRLDICIVKNLPIALVFLPASDIPRFVGESNVDIGITGQDVVLESGMQSLTKEMLRLGFGRCKLQVQVPEGSKIEREEDLAEKRIATSFEAVAGEHFGRIDARMGTKTKIEYLSGSVETACTLGLAEGIVDLVESGETMRAAGLKPISTIMSSEAVFIVSSDTKKPHMSAPVEQLKSRLAGVVASSKYVLCQFNIRRVDLPRAKAVTPGRRGATVSPLDQEDWVAVSSMVEREKAAVVMDHLQAVGAEDIFLTNIENCRV
ncbi:hypothetical protein FRC08_007280 [Ceratobasidium sp. 394]|nr:hypothetical protein FRC08_007280 [Ceratobasidium sp. 394]